MTGSLILAVLLALFPSRIKIFILRKMGAQIGSGCHIGITVIQAREIEIGNNVRVASFNLMHRLVVLKLADGSRLNGFNWITGASIGSLLLGRNSAITRLHFFEASGDVRIGENTIIAGRNSHFFTHGISSTNLDDIKPIEIGPWCYIGSSSRFVPGSSVGRGTFVGMGSVVTKPFKDEYVLIAGNPAAIRKKLSSADVYFSRAFLPHDHHLPDYNGGETL